MGTQQILLIVLSVIIVGVAIVVGIGMFNRQAYNLKWITSFGQKPTIFKVAFSYIS